MSKPSSNGKHKIALFISLAISLGIIVYLFSKVEWHEVFAQIKNLNPWFIPVLPLAFLPMIWLRWKLLLPNRDQLSVPRLMDATIIGFFASFVLPLRAGEIIRPWVVTRWQPVKFSTSIASIIIERLFDSICLLALMLTCLSQIPDVPPEIITGAYGLLSLTGILIGVVILSYLLPGKVEAVFHKLTNSIIGRFSEGAAVKINGMVVEYFAGLRIISTFRQLAMVLFLSFVMWLSVAAWYQGLLWAFGEFPSFWVGMVVNVGIALAIALPSAPGFIGVFQAGCIFPLSYVYGYSEEFAMAYSIIGHLMQMVFTITAGLIVLHLRGLRFNQLKPTGDKEVETSAA